MADRKETIRLRAYELWEEEGQPEGRALRHWRQAEEELAAGKLRETAPEPADSASGGQSNADMAADAAPGERTPGEDMDRRQDQLLDEAVEETFPASDPIAPKRIT